MVKPEFSLCARVIPNTEFTTMTQQAKLKDNENKLHCRQQHKGFGFDKF